ncbi:hypothetical protein HS088_TW15G00885 [Tripterygium wilfordii]|uniref:Uncharacterized protein n=1 Tax=Tripterygium wilfordii TaxID=458696 RepID=A0A7J7CMT0_TRIWF|nr:hypothetical protein HS088_TW15G00885 [Tripterygium wilfordii]
MDFVLVISVGYDIDIETVLMACVPLPEVALKYNVCISVDFKAKLHNLLINLTISLESKIKAKFTTGIAKLHRDLGLSDVMEEDVNSDNSKSPTKTSTSDIKVSRFGNDRSVNHEIATIISFATFGLKWSKEDSTPEENFN